MDAAAILAAVNNNTKMIAQMMPAIKSNTDSIARQFSQEKTRQTAQQKERDDKARASADRKNEEVESSNHQAVVEELQKQTEVQEEHTSLLQQISENIGSGGEGGKKGGGGLLGSIFNYLGGALGKVLKRQTGGLIPGFQTGGFLGVGEMGMVPGVGSGDTFSTMLPAGSFVLNRNATDFMFQEGGMVPVMLEPGEMVFGPGAWDPMVEAMNSIVPRFQDGGFVFPLTKGHAGTAPYQVFGAPRDGGSRKHAGLDLVENQPWGSDPQLPVVSTKRGMVQQELYTPSGYVAGMIVSQEDGMDSRYVHMIPEVRPGTEVEAGQRIGKLVNLGDNSHLHYELYKNQSHQALDPAPYLSSAGKAPDGATLQGMHPTPDGPKGTQTTGRSEDGSPESRDALREGRTNSESSFTATTLAGLLKQFSDLLLPTMSNFMDMLFLGNPAAAATLDAHQHLSSDVESGVPTPPTEESQPTSDLQAGGASAPAMGVVKSMGFSKADWNLYRNTVAEIESGGKYDIKGGSGGHYDGRYQMGAAAKTDAARYLGISDPGHDAAAREAFRKNDRMQERFFAAFTKANHTYLMGNPKYAQASSQRKLQILGYAHNQGMGGADNWLNTGQVGKDGFGTKGTKYTDNIAAEFRRRDGGGQVAQRQTGGPVGMQGNMMSYNRFREANRHVMNRSSDSSQPVIIPLPTPVGGGGGGTQGSARVPDLPAQPSNPISAALMMQSYSMMSRIG